MDGSSENTFDFSVFINSYLFKYWSLRLDAKLPTNSRGIKFNLKFYFAFSHFPSNPPGGPFDLPENVFLCSFSALYSGSLTIS